ncbi:MAG: hypothetical protein HQL45_14210 [Alphaproteobacteria bacterium]|nr:hypothetical protein [Alphaproteobacteria bacterium]
MALAVTKMSVPAKLAPFWNKHGERAARVLEDYLSSCPSNGEKLGALGVLGHLLLTYGDSIQVLGLANAKGNKN